MATKNILLDYMRNKETQSNQAASTGIGRSIDSQQDAWNKALADEPSTYKTWNPDVDTTPQKTNNLLTFTDEWKQKQADKKAETEQPKKKSWFASLIEDANKKSEENPWSFDATNNIIDTTQKAETPKEEPKEEPKAEEKKPLEYSDAFLKQEEQKDAWQPTWSNDKTIFDSPEINGMERAISTVQGAAKQYGSGMVNLYGTTAAGMNELSDVLGGNTNPYAGYITDELSQEQIGYEHDPEYYEREKKYTDSVQAVADSMSESAASDLEKAKDGLGFLGQAGIDIATNVIQMGFDTALAAMSGGTSALIPMFLRSAGSKAQEARQEGATTWQQLTSGALSGGVEVFTEKIADGLAGIYGKGLADEVTEEFIRKLAKTDLGRTTLRLFAGAVEEGGEEVLSDLLNPFVEMVYNNKDLYGSYKDLSLSDILYDFFIGAAVGGLGGGTNIITGGSAEANAALSATDAVENNLVESGVDPYTAELVAPTVEKAINGERLTQKEKNIVLEFMNREDVKAGSNETANATETVEAETTNPLVPKEEAGKKPTKAAQLETELDTAEENKQSTTSPQTAPQKEAPGNNPSKAAQVQTELDKANPLVQEETVANATEEAEEQKPDNTNKKAQLETELDKAEENKAAAPAEETTEEVETTAETKQPAEKPDTTNKKAQVETELDTAKENPLVQQEEAPTVEQEEESVEQPVEQEISEEAEEEREITPEMEEAERKANAGEEVTPAEQNRIDNALNQTIEQKEAATQKAAQTTVNEKSGTKLSRITPITENEKILVKDRQRLKTENDNLRERVNYLSTQMKPTEIQTADKADVRKAARSLITQEESSADTTEVTDMLQQLANYLVQNSGENIDYSEVERMAGQVAETIMDGATIEVDSGSKQVANDVIDYFKTTPIDISEADTGDVTGGFSEFKNKYRGKIKFSPKGIGVDVAYMELADAFPGYFPEDITHPADQLAQIGDVIDEAEPKLVNRYDADQAYDQVYAELTQQVIDTVLSDAIGQTAPTFADKANAKYNALKAKDAAKLKELREAKNARMKEIREEAAASKREAVAKEKAAKWSKVKAVQDYYKNILERGENRRKSAGIRKRIKGLAKDISDRLTKPKEGHYVPQDLAKAAVELLQDLDFNTGNENTAVRIDKLQSAYKQLMADPTYGSIMTDDVIQARLDQLAEYVGGTRVADMSLGQLEAVYDVVNGLSKNIRDAVKIRINGEERNAFNVSESLRQEVENAKSWGKNKVLSALNSWYSSAVLRPTTYFDRLGGFVKNSAWSEVADMLNEGQRKTTEQIVKGSQAFEDLMNDENTAQLRDTVSIGKDAAGNDIEISKGMRAALYMHLLNEDNTRHIKYGGLTIPGIEDYYKGNNDSGFGTSHSRALGISPELAKLQHEYNEIAQEYKNIDAEEVKDEAWQNKIDDVVERMDAKEEEIDALYETGEDYIANLKEKLENELTPIERRWVETARSYLDEMQNLLNDTTLDVYGFKKALVQNYFPIITDPNFRAAAFETIAKDMSLENSGFMKNRANGANPMLLLDISEVINRYMDNSSKYIGLMPAIRQFNKLYGKSQAGYANSLKDAIASKYGSSASDYIENLIADLTGARKSGDDFLSPFFAKARGHMAQAALSLNPRVALSQAASYMNAASEIGWSPLLKAFGEGDNPARNAEAMKLVTKWSPLEYYRSMGYSTTELGDVKSDSRIENRAMKKLGFAMKWIEMVDTNTVGRLWYAAEAYTQQTNPDLAKGSDEYYQEVAKTFNRVVERTQPNYTVMQRPGILRSTSDITKSLTMFMTQRLQNFNILYEAGQRFAQYESDFRDGKNGVTQEDLNQAKTDLANAVTSQVASTAMLVALKAGVDALLHSVKGYRDDDDKLTVESVMSKIADMYADAMLGNLLGGSELYSFSKSLLTGERYYGISLSGVDAFSDLLSDIVSATNASDEQKAKKWGEVAKSLAQFFGVPVNNASKMIDGIRYQAEDIINGNFGQFVAGTDYKTAPDTVTDSDGNKYTLTSEDQKVYSDSYTQTRDKYYEQFQSSSYYDGLTDQQKEDVEKSLNNAAKDQAKYEYLKGQGVKEDNPASAHEADLVALKTLGNKANGSFAKNKDTDYETLDYIVKNIYPKLSKAEKDALNSSSSYSRYDNMADCAKVGIDSETFAKYLNKAREIDNSSRYSSATAQAEAYAAYVDTQKGLTSAQRSALKSIYKYTTTIVSNTKSYDKWTAAGLSPEDAQGFAKKANADGNGSNPTNKEWFAAIEKYATSPEMAEKLWQATGSKTTEKKTYLQANPSSKFKNSGYSPSKKSTEPSGNILLDYMRGNTGSSSSSSYSGSTSSGTTNNLLLDYMRNRG